MLTITSHIPTPKKPECKVRTLTLYVPYCTLYCIVHITYKYYIIIHSTKCVCTCSQLVPSSKLEYSYVSDLATDASTVYHSVSFASFYARCGTSILCTYWLRFMWQHQHSSVGSLQYSTSNISMPEQDILCRTDVQAKPVTQCLPPLLPLPHFPNQHTPFQPSREREREERERFLTGVKKLKLKTF